MPAKVDTISGPEVNAQFHYSFAYRLAVPKVASLDLAQTNSNTRLGDLIPHRIQPFSEWFAPIFALIPEKFDHEQL